MATQTAETATKLYLYRAKTIHWKTPLYVSTKVTPCQKLK
jgi:hypothetical protein